MGRNGGSVIPSHRPTEPERRHVRTTPEERARLAVKAAKVRREKAGRPAPPVQRHWEWVACFACRGIGYVSPPTPRGMIARVLVCGTCHGKRKIRIESAISVNPYCYNMTGEL